jgi:hypothetical protein
MAFGDFTLEQVIREFGITAEIVPLYSHLKPIAVPIWLTETLARTMDLPLTSEKARSEFIVLPVLVASRDLAGKAFTIYSGQNLNVDSARGLVGECDFVLARTPSLPDLTAPLVTIVEAKRAEIEPAIGQCAAQMVGATLFNEQNGRPVKAMHGCVTTGEAWQFLRLAESRLEIDRQRYYIDNPGLILAIFQSIVALPPAAEPSAHS